MWHSVTICICNLHVNICHANYLLSGLKTIHCHPVIPEYDWAENIRHGGRWGLWLGHTWQIASLFVGFVRLWPKKGFEIPAKWKSTEPHLKLVGRMCAEIPTGECASCKHPVRVCSNSCNAQVLQGLSDFSWWFWGPKPLNPWDVLRGKVSLPAMASPKPWGVTLPSTTLVVGIPCVRPCHWGKALGATGIAVSLGFLLFAMPYFNKECFSPSDMN